MRAGIGLVALLIGVGLMVYMFAQFEIPKMKTGKHLKAQAQQISGRGEGGEAASDSFATQPQFKGSRFEGLSVTSIMAGGAMDSYYGLRQGDTILAINGMRLADISNGDEEMAKSLVAEAFSKKQELMVRRGGQTLNLPSAAGFASPPPGPAPGNATATPAPAQSPAPAEAPTAADVPSNPSPAAPAPAPAPRQSRGLQGQLDGIRKAAGGGQDQEQ
jgi:hypothetical protein